MSIWQLQISISQLSQLQVFIWQLSKYRFPYDRCQSTDFHMTDVKVADVYHDGCQSGWLYPTQNNCLLYFFVLYVCLSICSHSKTVCFVRRLWAQTYPTTTSILRRARMIERLNYGRRTCLSVCECVCSSKHHTLGGSTETSRPCIFV